MTHQISIKECSDFAWQALKSHQTFWMLLILINILVTGLKLYGEQSGYVFGHAYVLPVAYAMFSMMWYAIISNNALDVVYGKKMSMLHLSKYVVLAAVFDMNNFSKVVKYATSLVAVVEVEWLRTCIVVAIQCVYFYITVRCLFIGMILLHDKSSIMQACKNSLRLTSGNFFTVLGAVLYCFVAMGVSLFAFALLLAGVYLVFSLGFNFHLKNIIVNHLELLGMFIVLPVFFYLFIYFKLFLTSLFKQLDK